MRAYAKTGLEVLAGFIGVAIGDLVLGLMGWWLLKIRHPGQVDIWASESLAVKIAVFAFSLVVGLSLIVWFWRRRRAVSYGVLLYVLYDFVRGLSSF